MFTVLYSGADSNSKAQNDPLKSIGGYISSSAVPNGSINNIFPPITRRHIKEQLIDTRLIVLKNDATALTAVKIWTEKDNLATFKIAAVAPGADSCSKPLFESLVDGHSIPMQASLAAKEGEGAALVVGNIAANQIIGIWIQRDVDVTKFNELDGVQGIESLTNDELEELLIANPITTKVYDEPKLIIDWA